MAPTSSTPQVSIRPEWRSRCRLPLTPRGWSCVCGRLAPSTAAHRRRSARLEPKDEKWQAKFKVLKESVEHHIKEEEGTIFPEARQLIGETAAHDLDIKYSEVEKKIAA